LIGRPVRTKFDMPVFYSLKVSKLKDLIKGKDNEKIISYFNSTCGIFDVFAIVRVHSDL